MLLYGKKKRVKIVVLLNNYNYAVKSKRSNCPFGSEWKKVLKKDIAARLFPGVSTTTQQVNMTSLCNGKTKRILPEWVIVICEMCDCTPNYLFGYDDK